MIDKTIPFPVGDNPTEARLLYGVSAPDGLILLEDNSVQTICTSPPYWGLRDYGADGQIGLEDDIEEYIANLVAVFDECKRVLRKDGTLWLNLGDSYASQGEAKTEKCYASAGTGFKPKDLIGIPWRVALALQADGWYLRNEIIWSKPNPMPESVRDRLTRSHEHIFLFAHPDSGGKYYYDIEAIKEPLKASSKDRNKYEWSNRQRTHDPNENRDARHTASGAMIDEAKGSNKRTVWNVTPSSFRGAHFATWPPKLVEPMVLAGCPKGGTVLDPFSGSATTGEVALSLGRDYVGIDLNEDYLSLAECRVQGVKATKPKDEVPEMTTLDMFGVDS